VIKIVITVLAIGLFTFLFGLRTANVGGVTLLYPYPDMYNNINTLIFAKMQIDFLGVTPTIELIQIGVADAMIIQLELSLFLGLTFGMPVIVYQIYRFLKPALKSNEKSMIMAIAVPATILFILGSMFAYVLIIPFTFEFLYGYTIAMGVSPTLSMEKFLSFILLFQTAFGIVFEMPVIQYGLTKLRLVKPQFWIDNWKYAFVAMIIFAAVITPDGSGITQMMIAVPMLGLYFLGYLIARHTYNKQQKLERGNLA
jgi:sec-independent protein translocase protein TatC